MEQTFRVRLAKYLQHRRNFMKVAAVTFGVPFAVGSLSMFGPYGGIGWWLFLIAAAIPAAWLWAFFMWFVCENDLRRMSSDSAAQKVKEGTPE